MAAQVLSSARTRMYFKMLFENGQVTSRYDQYIANTIRGGDQSFYTRILAQQGIDAAEAELLRWSREERKSDYASLIEPVVRGMQSLARADTGHEGKLVKLINITRDAKFPHHYLLREGKLATLTNPNLSDHGCDQPFNEEIFGPMGRLGIRAIVLATDSYNPEATQLNIVLPVRISSKIDPERRAAGFTVLTIDTTGYTDAITFLPDEPDPDYLMKLLGLSGSIPPRLSFSSGGHLDDAIGFPGATDYLADKLPLLEQYLADVAAVLNSEHRH